MDAFAVVPADQLAATPAGVPTAAKKAWQALFETARVQRGRTVSVHGGAGAVGGFAVLDRPGHVRADRARGLEAARREGQPVVPAAPIEPDVDAATVGRFHFSRHGHLVRLNVDVDGRLYRSLPDVTAERGAGRRRLIGRPRTSKIARCEKADGTGRTSARTTPAGLGDLAPGR